MRVRKVDVPSLRAAWWAVRASHRARVRLTKQGLHKTLVLPQPPAVAPEAIRGVNAVLRRRDDTCLVRAAVLQAWHAGHGRPRDVIIGVTAPSDNFRAHAWLEGERPCHGDKEFTELLQYGHPLGSARGCASSR